MQLSKVLNLKEKKENQYMKWNLQKGMLKKEYKIDADTGEILGFEID